MGSCMRTRAVTWLRRQLRLMARAAPWLGCPSPAGDVVCWPTNMGWMMGPWLLYAALLNGATIALFTGSPLGREFGVFVASARVTMLGLVPSIVKVRGEERQHECMDNHRQSHWSQKQPGELAAESSL